MDCRKVKRLLNRYSDQELAGKDMLVLVETHLNECALCRKELAALTAVKGLLARKEKITVTEDFLSGLRNRLRGEPQVIRVRWLPEAGDWARRLIPLPAVALSLLFVLLWTGLNGKSPVDEYIYAGLSNEELAIVNGYITNSDLLQSIMNIK